MANFCSKCGRALDTGTRFCPGCGAPIVVPAESVANTLHAATEESDPRVLQAMKGRTMRIDLGEDF